MQAGVQNNTFLNLETVICREKPFAIAFVCCAMDQSGHETNPALCWAKAINREFPT